MKNALLRAVGWPATILHGDPAVFDRWRWLRAHLASGPVRTLDAGCGSGAFTMYAARMGNEAVGMSFDLANQRKAEERARILGLENVRFVTGDLRVLDGRVAELGQFDQILCLETIEHILDDAKLIRDLASLLRPGGRLLLTTPYKHYRPLLGDQLSATEDGGHVRWGYTHDEIAALFAAEGIEVVAREYVSGWVPQKIMNLMRRIGRVNAMAGWALTFPLRILQPLDGLVTRATGYPHLSIGVVGRKSSGPLVQKPV